MSINELAHRTPADAMKTLLHPFNTVESIEFVHADIASPMSLLRADVSLLADIQRGSYVPGVRDKGPRANDKESRASLEKLASLGLIERANSAYSLTKRALGGNYMLAVKSDSRESTFVSPYRL